VVALFVLASLIFLLAGSTAAQRGLDTVVFAQYAATINLDTAGNNNLQVYPSGAEAAHLIYDGLVRFTEDLAIVPELATSWRTSNDGLTWTFRLRRSIAFHDGSPLNAQAVAFHVNREVNPATNPSNRALWDPVLKAEAVDDATVNIITRFPYPSLLNTLAHQSGLVASMTAFQRLGDQYKTNPSGTGPYRVERWNVGTELILVRNEKYWGDSPRWPRIVLRHVPDPATRVALMQAGQAHVVTGLPPENVNELRFLRKVEVIIRPSLRAFGVAMNMNRPLFQDARVRQAFNFAVDKDAIIKAIFRGYASPLTSPISPKTPDAAKLEPYAFNPERARRLLGEAGWLPGPGNMLQKDGQPLRVSFLAPDGWFPKDVEVVEAVQAYLRAVGVDASIVKLEPAAYRPRILAPAARKDYDLAFYGFNPSNGDSVYHVQGLFESTYVQNIGSYVNKQVDSWIAEADRTLNRDARRRISEQIQRQIWQDAPYIWLYAEPVIVAKQKDMPDVNVLPILFTILRSPNRTAPR
jgi:peptide/nickel transport system substrate-binding protein